MKLQRKIVNKGGISTASMPDIIFMLLIFFMMSTVLREYEGLNVILPSAKKIEKLETKKHVAYIWVSRDGAVSVDDRIIPMDKIRDVMYAKRAEDPQVVISMRADRSVDMSVISNIHNELRKADALKVNYSAKTAVN